MPDTKMVTCPFCGFDAPEKGDAQNHHMKSEHPEVIQQRLRDEGFVLINGRWVDVLSGSD